MSNITAIILAAGSGKRTGLKYNKVLYEINDKRILDYSIDKLKKYDLFTQFILVVSEEEYDWFSTEYQDRVDDIVIGGKERQDSVLNALNKAKNSHVLIHDGARPYIPTKAIEKIITVFETYPSITLGVQVKDTIQRVSGNLVVETFNRSELIQTQTPQVFNKALLLESHTLAKKDSFTGTDDTMLMEKYLNIQAYVVEGDYRNIKLTTLDDAKLLEVIL